MKIARFGLGFAAVALGFSLLSGSAVAQPASPGAMMSSGAMMVDCTKAGDTMMQAGKMDGGAAMTGDVDKDFAATAMMHEKSMMVLQQVEVQCGKNAKLKAAAAKGLHDSQMRVEMFRNEGQS